MLCPAGVARPVVGANDADISAFAAFIHARIYRDASRREARLIDRILWPFGVHAHHDQIHLGQLLEMVLDPPVNGLDESVRIPLVDQISDGSGFRLPNVAAVGGVADHVRRLQHVIVDQNEAAYAAHRQRDRGEAATRAQPDNPNRPLSKVSQRSFTQQPLDTIPTHETLSFASTSGALDRKSTRLNSSHVRTSYAVFCLKKKK